MVRDPLLMEVFMFAHALPLGSLRPAEILPPTLTPNAILAMAPPAPRGMSLLGASLVYTACAAGLLLTPAIQSRGNPPPTVRVIFDDSTTAVVVPTTARPAPPAPRPGLIIKNAPQRPEGWTPPLDTTAVPATPTTLPTRNDSWNSVRAGTPEDALRPTLPASPEGLGHGSTRPTTVDFDFRQMRILQQVEPVYPALARSAKIQGEVVLLMAVDSHGIPTSVKALSGPHASLEQEAMRVARLWRFEPASLNGQPVSAQFRLTILFRLR